MIWTPRTRTRQPQGMRYKADPRHGMNHLWWAGGCSGDVAAATLADAAGGAHGVLGSGTPGNPHGTRLRVDSDGHYLLSDNTGTGTVNSTQATLGNASGSGGIGSDVFTILTRIYCAPANGGSLYGSGVSNNGVSLRIYNNKIDLLKQGVSLIGTCTSDVATSRWLSFAVTYDGLVARFYIDGVADGSGSNAQTFDHGVQYWMGSGYGGGEALGNNVRVRYLSTAPRVLPAGFIQSVHMNPWQLFAPQRTPVFYSISGSSSAVVASYRMRRPGLSRAWR